MKDLNYVLILTIIAVVIVIITPLIFCIVESVTSKTEVTTEECVITKIDSNAYYKKNFGTKTEYIIAVKGWDKFAVTIKISESDYAELNVGDTVMVNKIHTVSSVSDYWTYELVN
jgi:ABC-type glycerol-3-phosphate transport system permease component